MSSDLWLNEPLQMRNPRVERAPLTGTLTARPWLVLVEESTDGFESWWDDVVIASFSTRTEAETFARSWEADEVLA